MATPSADPEEAVISVYEENRLRVAFISRLDYVFSHSLWMYGR